MRFIRCARHKDEQNMVVFQYGNNIYYRAVRDIPAGTELLVWYNNNYTQFLGVPLGLRNVPGCKSEQDKKASAQTVRLMALYIGNVPASNNLKSALNDGIFL